MEQLTLSKDLDAVFHEHSGSGYVFSRRVTTAEGWSFLGNVCDWISEKKPVTTPTFRLCVPRKRSVRQIHVLIGNNQFDELYASSTFHKDLAVYGGFTSIHHSFVLISPAGLQKVCVHQSAV